MGNRFYTISDPPGPPVISGYIEGETIRVDQTVNLACVAAGGNPLAEVIWYRDGVKKDTSFTSSGLESRNTYSFLATSDDDGAKFRCEAKNKLSPAPMTAEIVLDVQCEYKI